MLLLEFYTIYYKTLPFSSKSIETDKPLICQAFKQTALNQEYPGSQNASHFHVYWFYFHLPQ